MKKEKKLVKCTHPHYCYEWDSLFITPIMSEFQCCTCACDGAEYKDEDWHNLIKSTKGDTHGAEYQLKKYLKHIGKNNAIS